jgi:hydroxymethylbilane synthase
MASKTYILGTRASPLAMWQAQFVQWLLEEQWPEDHFTILGIKTSGDNQAISIAKEGGKGLYVKELQEALLEKKVDFCVHSLKDYPVIALDGCALAAIIERGEVRDVLVSREKKPLVEFTESMKIGTSSLRRKALLKAQGIPSQIVEIRGNVDTRVRKMKEGEVDGIILASAGLLRLGLESEVTEYLDPKTFIPAPGQGAIAVDCRADDDDIRLKLRRIHHEESGQATSAERAFLKALGANCALPLGAWCEIEQFQIRLHAFISDPEGKNILMERSIAPIGYADQLGNGLAQRFLAQGARRILDQV